MDIKAEKGAYLLNSEVVLEPNESKEWMLVADVNQTISDIVEIKSERYKLFRFKINYFKRY